MDSILKKGVLLVSVTGIMTAFPMVVHAADIDDTQNIPAAESTQILEDCYTSDKTISVKDHLVPEQKGEYSDMAFANVQSFLYIRSEPTTDSEWVGKLYPDYAAKITGPVGEWTKVESGNVTGYVYSRYITVGNEAQKKAEELVQNNDTGNVEDAFTYAESREEEAARLQKEQEEQKAQAAGNGQAIVDYACQFIGNPYVWRYEPHKRSGLFRIRTVGICTFWNRTSAYDMGYGECGNGGKLRSGSCGRHYLI